MATKPQYVKSYHSDLLALFGLLKGNEFELYMCLKMHENRATGDCFPSFDTIQSETHLRREAIWHGLEALEAKGLIEVREVKLRRGRHRNDYTLKPISKVLKPELKQGSENGT